RDQKPSRARDPFAPILPPNSRHGGGRSVNRCLRTPTLRRILAREPAPAKERKAPPKRGLWKWEVYPERRPLTLGHDRLWGCADRILGERIFADRSLGDRRRRRRRLLTRQIGGGSSAQHGQGCSRNG